VEPEESGGSGETSGLSESPEDLAGGAEGPITYDFRSDLPEPPPAEAVPEAPSAPIAEPEVREPAQEAAPPDPESVFDPGPPLPLEGASAAGQEIAPFDEAPPPSGAFTFEPPPPTESGAGSQPLLFPTEEMPAPAPVLEALVLPAHEEEPGPPEEAETAPPPSPDGRLDGLERRIEALEKALSSLRLALAPLASFTGEARKDAASGDEPEDPGAG